MFSPDVMELPDSGILQAMIAHKVLRVFIQAALLVGASGCGFDNGSILSYVKRVTKISIPSHTKTLSEYDQGEFEAVGKYQLRPEDLQPFIRQYPFHLIDRQCKYMSHFNVFSQSDLIPRADSIPFGGGMPLKYFQGCKGSNAWLFIVDEKSGALWIEVQYPDRGGLAPTCKL